MSKLKSPSDRKPLLSTQRPSCWILRSSVSSIPIRSASMTKAQTPNRLGDMEELEIHPEYQSISCELKALAKMVENDFGNHELGNADSSPLFERGRFYDEYSARRNERLKRKKFGEKKEDCKRSSVCNLGVAVESGKKRDLKKHGCVRKSVPANFSIGDGRTENQKYSLRVRSNIKAIEDKNPSIPIAAGRSMVDGFQKVGAPRVRKI